MGSSSIQKIPAHHVFHKIYTILTLQGAFSKLMQPHVFPIFTHVSTKCLRMVSQILPSDLAETPLIINDLFYATSAAHQKCNASTGNEPAGQNFPQTSQMEPLVLWKVYAKLLVGGIHLDFDLILYQNRW